ncbi:MAG: DUF4835 family protein [Bacteroidaceae bacterium]|nr:DUF4835 family protein [Bacteroidaceae bacterium]
MLLVLPVRQASAQELKPTVSVNASKIQGTDKDVFQSLETALQEFMDNMSWTNYRFADNERINCYFSFVVNEYDQSSGKMDCELTVQSNRPVYNSSYNSPVFSFRDENCSFNYTEQDRIEFTETNISSNLTAILAFYSYLIIGMDFDTMSLKGGTDILQTAMNICNNSQSLGSGWRSFDSNQNRYSIINDYLNGSLESFRQLQYDYHRKGLDDMVQNAERGRGTITKSLELLQQTKKTKSTSILPSLFTEIKRDELVNIYSKGLAKEKESVAELLSDINPSLSEDWNQIKSSK